MAPLQIAPSILAADFANLGDAVALVADTADTLHVDVMDGHFVPNLSIGPPVVKSLRKATSLHLDCHLMMTNPGDYLEAFKKAISTVEEEDAKASAFSQLRKLNDTRRHSDAYRGLALTYLSMGKVDDAVATLKTAVETSDTSARVGRGLVVIDSSICVATITGLL